MKPTPFLSLLLATFLILGCSSNSDDNNEGNDQDLAATKQKLIGSWRLMGVESNLEEEYYDASDCPDYIVHFSADDTCVSDFYHLSVDDVCEFDGTSVTSPYYLQVNEAFGTIEVWVDFEFSEAGDLPPIPSPMAVKHISSTELQLAGVLPSGTSFEYEPIFYYEKE